MMIILMCEDGFMGEFVPIGMSFCHRPWGLDSNGGQDAQDRRSFLDKLDSRVLMD